MGFSQELPPIIKYSPATYGAGNQNWMVSQDKNHFVFFANNNGLLEFNGSNWTLYPSPNETILRSVKVINDRIYTGCYMDFGYWIRKSNGKLKYTSLSKPIQKHIQDDEQFWNIGIRIEDDAVINNSGCELISRGAPVKADDIEALMKIQ